MLRKLLKYDIMFSKTHFFAMAAALIFCASLLRAFKLFNINSFQVAFSLVLTAIIFTCIVLIFQNFNKNLFSGEGYLKLTLPVKRHSVINSKLVVSMFWFNFMLLAGVIAACVLALEFGSLNFSITMSEIITILLTLVFCNILALNFILILYLLASSANITIRGRRTGFIVSGIFTAIFCVAEITFAVKILHPIQNLSLVYLRSGEFKFVSNISLDISQSVVMSISLTPILTALLFSIISYLLNLHFLKRRVDLQ